MMTNKDLRRFARERWRKFWPTVLAAFVLLFSVYIALAMGFSTDQLVARYRRVKERNQSEYFGNIACPSGICAGDVSDYHLLFHPVYGIKKHTGAETESIRYLLYLAPGELSDANSHFDL